MGRCSAPPITATRPSPRNPTPTPPAGFAAHGATAAPPALTLVVGAPFAAEAKIGVRAFDLAPGRGLAAPPPPSHAPPVQLI